MKKFYVIILSTFLSVNQIHSQTIPNYKYNNLPKYQKNNLLKLTKSISIDVLNVKDFAVSAIGWMDVDNNGDLYVLAHLEKQILVFNKNGEFLRKMGTPGSGPTQLDRPHSFYVYKKKLFIFEEYRGIKVWDTHGNYVSFLLKNSTGTGAIMQYPLFRPISNIYIGFHWEFSGNPRNNFHKNNILAVYSNKLKKINDIYSIKIDPTKYYNYNLVEIMAIDSENNLYLPDSENPQKYIINKYDLDGNKILSFGRKYNHEGYSLKVRKWFNQRYNKNKKNSSTIRAIPDNLPEYPPVIRHLMVDNNDLIWIIAGEWYADNDSFFRLFSTIDIFNKNGDYLYAFRSDKFNCSCFIKKNLLYCKPIAKRFLTRTEESTINIYKIDILFEY